MAVLPLGILASSGGGAAGSFELIQTVNGTGSSGTITFSSIPATYKHLQIRYTVRTDYGTGGHGLFLNFNGVTSSSYYAHRLYGNGSSVTSNTETTGTAINVGFMPGDGATANVYAGGVLDVLDYANTSKNKTTRNLTGYTSGYVMLNSGLFMSTSAISSLSFTPQYGGNFTTASRFSLYGIKGS